MRPLRKIIESSVLLFSIQVIVVGFAFNCIAMKLKGKRTRVVWVEGEHVVR